MRGGYNVYPVEVEGVLSTHPDVAAVAVVPRPDPVMGEVGVACRRAARRVPPAVARGAARARRRAPRRVQAPRGARESSSRCRSPRWRRSTAGPWRRCSWRPHLPRNRPPTEPDTGRQVRSGRRMELEFTDDQEELRDGVRAMLARECPMSLVRAVVEDGASADGLWKQMVELGLARAHRPRGARRARARHGRARGRRRGARPVARARPASSRRSRSSRRSSRELGDAPSSSTASSAPSPTGTMHRHARDRRGAASASTPSRSCNARRDARRRRLARSRARRTAVLGGDDVDEIAVVARVAGTTGDDGVGAFVVPRADAARHARSPRSTRRAASRPCTSTACTSPPTGCSASRGPAVAAGAAPSRRGGHRRARARDGRARARPSST